MLKPTIAQNDNCIKQKSLKLTIAQNNNCSILQLFKKLQDSGNVRGCWTCYEICHANHLLAACLPHIFDRNTEQNIHSVEPFLGRNTT